MVQPGSRGISIARTAVACGYGLLGWLLLTSLWGLWVAHFPGVYVDMWDEMPFLQRLDEGRSSWHDWLNAYAGSHRLLLPRAVFAIEHSVFAHANVFTAAVSLVFQAAALLLAWLFVRRSGLPAATRHGVIIALLAAGVSALHLYNVLYPFLVQWFQVLAFSLLAFACLISTTNTAYEKRGAALAWLCALLASFSCLPGVIALFNLALLGIALRSRLRWPLAAVCLATVAVHMTTLPGSNNSAQLVDLIATQPLMLMMYPVYIIRFLGSPLTALSEPAGMLLGTGIFTYTAWHGLRWLWRGSPVTPAAAFALSGLMWLCGTATATALGRATAPVTAIAERFDTLHLWSVPLLCLHWACSTGSRRSSQAFTVAITTWIALLVYLQPVTLQKTLDNSQRVQMSHIAYTLDMTDWRTHRLLSIPQRADKRNPAVDWREYLQAHRNGIYAYPVAHWDGEHFAGTVQALPPCIGQVALTPLDNGFAEVRIGITGSTRPVTAWVIDENQQVIGYALRTLPEGLFDSSDGLAGYTRNNTVWAVIGNPQSEPCLLGKSLP